MTVTTDQQISEEESQRYSRQLYTWGLEAQNRIRSATVLIIGLRSAAQETVKNVMLAGVGKLIIMDDKEVMEEDLGAGLLFREEEGAVGKKRVEAAIPQIRSLNPYVQVQALTSTEPFILPDGTTNLDVLTEYIRSEKIDLICTTDLTKDQMIKINEACRRSNTLFYGSGTYGFLGYVFADLGEGYQWVSQSTSLDAPDTTTISRETIDFVPLSEAASISNVTNPFKDKKKAATNSMMPGLQLSIQALWEWQSQNDGRLPSNHEAEEWMSAWVEEKRQLLEVNPKSLREAPKGLISQLTTQAPFEFAPTAAIVGGILAADILKALGRKEKPIVNLLVIDTMSGDGAAVNWGAKERSPGAM